MRNLQNTRGNEFGEEWQRIKFRQYTAEFVLSCLLLALALTASAILSFYI